MKFNLRVVAAVWLQAVLGAIIEKPASEPAFDSRCAQFASRLTVDQTTIYFSQYLAASIQLQVPDQNATCLAIFPTLPNVTVDVCRVAGYTATSSRSGSNFEVWLPKNWTGRFISHGGSGLSGCMPKRILVLSLC
jgi:feruloyl esterase